jgi:small subunit ribosomal protein S4
MVVGEKKLEGYKMNHGCRKCRRQGVKLFLKGEKCFSPKCPVTTRPYAPGQHGPTKFKKISEYGKQLLEKQKVKNIYQINESQLKNYYLKAAKTTGNTSEKLVNLLESRLDSVVYNLGLYNSRSAARQAVSHGNFLLNDKKADIPSTHVKRSDKITIKKSEKISKNQGNKLPFWVEISKDSKSYQIKQIPSLNEIELAYDINLVIEYYSR